MIDPSSTRVPLSPEEENKSAETLKLMGHILSSWQAVETLIFELYLVFFDDNHYDVAALSFFAVRSFEARTQLVDALILNYGNAAQKASWEKLNRKIRKKSKIRNAIAHGLFGFFGRPPNRECVIARSIYDISKFPEMPTKNDFISAKEMMEACDVFVRLAKEISEFSNLLSSDEKLKSELRTPFQRARENSRRFPLTVHIPTKQPG